MDRCTTSSEQVGSEDNAMLYDFEYSGKKEGWMDG